jgi:hypothetical protein
MCRPAGTIPVGVIVKHRFQNWLQVSLHYRLGDAIRNRRNSERPRSSFSLRYVNPAYRRREVTSRRHSVPDPIKIVTQIFLERCNRLAVNSRRSSVCLHPLVCFPYVTLRNTKRFRSVHRSPPLFGLLLQHCWTTAPLRSTLITKASTLLRAPPPLCPASVLWPLQRLSA